MSSNPVTPSTSSRKRTWRFAGLVAASLMAAGMVAAQQNQPAADPSAAASAAAKSGQHRAPAAEAQGQPPSVDPQPAAQPEPPHWPVNDTPAKPSVTWDSHGLRIQANNASLHEILSEVSTDTGAKVEGLGTDERVFGEYGPGATRDVISQLLHGSNYNVLMIGDQGEGTPRQIVLSMRHAGNTPGNANRSPEEQPDEDFTPEEPQADDQPVQPPPMINGRQPMPMVPQGPPGAPRTPQQVLQELQQRQQQMQDQQQQQQQQPH